VTDDKKDVSKDVEQATETDVEKDLEKDTETADVEPTAVELDEVELDEVEGAAESDTEPDASAQRTPSRYRRLLVPALLGVLLVASVAFASFIYFTEYRPDRQTNAQVSADVLKAASDGTVALLSYSPESLDKDFATAKSHLTGDFLNYYTQFTNDIVTPAAKQKDVKTSAQVARSAVAELHPGSAEVLVFINQNTTSKENPDGSFTASSVKVGLTKLDGKWLISSFDPV
jgi:Mce-associated membrane protein